MKSFQEHFAFLANATWIQSRQSLPKYNESSDCDDIYFAPLLIGNEELDDLVLEIRHKFPNAKIIGATATPEGKHFYKYYQNIVQNIDIPELIELGYLSPCKAYQMQDDFSDLQTKAGEFTDQSLLNRNFIAL